MYFINLFKYLQSSEFRVRLFIYLNLVYKRHSLKSLQVVKSVILFYHDENAIIEISRISLTCRTCLDEG